GSAAPERRHVERNRARIDAPDGFVIEMQLREALRREARDHHVGPSKQFRDLHRRGACFEIELEHALGPVQDVKMWRAAKWRPSARLDLDCTRALLREQHRGVCGAQMRLKFNDIYSVECFAHDDSVASFTDKS